MAAKIMQSTVLSTQTGGGTAQKPVRLHYLDWLRVIATLGVFLFHASNVFNGTGFEIANAESSDLILLIQLFFYPWGMPLFFLIAGAASWFALRRRSASQFTRERTFRLLVPFLTGTLLLGPIQLYLSWRHRVETGVIDWTFVEFVAERLSSIGPKLFGAIGYHMWFLGYLFAFSLLALPLFIWLRGEKGRRAVSRLAGLCEHRGGILLFVLPLVAVRLALQPFFPLEHDWADFFSFGAFFVLGYLVFTDGRFTNAIRRDWWIILVAGIVATLAFGALLLSIESFNLEAPPATLPEILVWGLAAAAGWCWTAFMLFIGMRYLDRDSAALRYGQAAILPFFVVHQPVILAISYFVVQWDTGLLPKMLVVVLGGFIVSLGFYELLVRRVAPLRAMFGVKAAITPPASYPQEATPTSFPGSVTSA
jgi:glucan biosynthesis protein C